MAEEHGDGEMLDYTEGDAGADQADVPETDAPEQGGAGEQDAAAAGAGSDGKEGGQNAGLSGGSHGTQAEPDAAAGSGAGEDAAPASLTSAVLSDPLSQPPHGTEVYIANLPMQASDAQVKALASQVGEVFQLRLPKNPDGTNKGFGFIVYKTREAAEQAVLQLFNQELDGFPGRKVRLNESQSKNKLYFGNLPRSYTQKQLEDELKKAAKGVELVELMMDKDNPTVNRGFAFVTFYNYACAEAARKRYTETADNAVGGRPVNVTWAEPKRAEDTSHVKSIFVGNLPASVSEEKLHEVFKVHGEIEKVMLPYSKEDPTKYRDYGFVHFKERSSALEAVQKGQQSKPVLDGKDLQVALARPQHLPGEAGAQGGRGAGRSSYGSGYGGNYGGGTYGGRTGGPGRGYGRGGNYGGSSYVGGGYGGGRGYGGGYGGGRGYDDYGEDYGEEDYGGGGGYTAGYGAPAAAAAAVAPAAGGATMMVPVQLPSGQVGYMVVPTAGAASAAGPLRRVVAGGYGAAASTAGAYAAGAYGRGAAAYGYGARAGTSGSGGQYRSHPY